MSPLRAILFPKPPSRPAFRPAGSRPGLARLGGLALLGLLSPIAGAQSLETREVELASLRSEIAQMQEELGSLKSRRLSLEDELEVAQKELRLQQAKVSEADQELDLAEVKVEQARADVESSERALVEVRGDLRRRLGGLYRLGGQGFMRLFLAMEARENMLPAIRQLRFLVRRDRVAVDRYVEIRDRLAVEKEVLVDQLAEVEAWRTREVERRDDLKKVERRHRRLLERVAKEQRRLERREGALQEKERKLVRFMGDLVDSSNPESVLDGPTVQEFRGVLDWPARGEVVAEFGPRKDPRYNTEVPHHGLDLQLEAGTKVRVVFPGEVIYAAEFEGYGPMIVVHHPGRVFTLYAGLDLLNVGKGDVLSLGDVIGTSADLLYFEIRAENEPQNPRKWLR